MHVCSDPMHMLTKCNKRKHYYSGAGPRQKRKCSSMSCTDGASDRTLHTAMHCHPHCSRRKLVAKRRPALRIRSQQVSLFQWMAATFQMKLWIWIRPEQKVVNVVRMLGKKNAVRSQLQFAVSSLLAKG